MYVKFYLPSLCKSLSRSYYTNLRTRSDILLHKKMYKNLHIVHNSHPHIHSYNHLNKSLNTKNYNCSCHNHYSC